MSSTLFLLSYAIWHTRGNTFNGIAFTSDNDGQYENHILQCDDDQDCTILCKHPNSCRHTNVQCPKTGSCVIECNSGPSHNVCEGIHIDCPTNGDCTVQCSGDSACKDAHINGQTSTLSISCDGDHTCIHATVNGQNTASLSLQCAQHASETCSSLSIFVPPNINHHKRAVISAEDPLQFYAVNGWNDIESTDSSGTMRCGSQYEIECSLNHDDWQCTDDSDNICGNPSQTNSPIAQSDTATVSSISDSMIIYTIFGTSGIGLCFLGFACLFYVRYSQKRDDKACNSFNKVNSISALPTPVMITNLSMCSSISLNSSRDTLVKPSIKFKPYSSASATSNGCETGTDNSTPISVVTDAQTPSKTEDGVSPSQSTPETEEADTTNTNHNTMIYLSTPDAVNVEQSKPVPLPSLSTASGHEHVIIYQQPPQHQMSEIMSIMNESAPPSLSSFVRNHHNGAYVMNQQPIPPSAQSSTGSVTATHTITAADTALHLYKGSDPIEEISFVSCDESDQNDEDAVVETLDDIQSMEWRLQMAHEHVSNMN